MRCSICKKERHNKRGCPLVVKCKKCGRNGHTSGKCSYKTVYDSIPCLPKDIINLIMDSKTTQEENDNYREYFSRMVCKEICETGGFYGYERLEYSRPIVEKTIFYLNIHLRESFPTRQQKLENALLLYEHLYEFRWLFMKYYHRKCAIAFIKSSYDKLINHLFIHNMRNCYLYVDMFENRNKHGVCQCMIC